MKLCMWLIELYLNPDFTPTDKMHRVSHTHTKKEKTRKVKIQLESTKSGEAEVKVPPLTLTHSHRTYIIFSITARL